MGFEVRLRIVSYETMYSRFCEKPDAAVAVCSTVGWVPYVADGDSMLHSTFTRTGSSNYSRLAVPAIDAAIEKANTLSDQAARARAWGRIDRDLTAEAPAVPLLWDNSRWLASDNVTLATNAVNGGLVDLAHTSLK